MPQVRVGVGVFVFKNGRFIMGQRKGAHGEYTWSIPGGHLEFGETLDECAAREVLEETGVTISNAHFGAVTNDIFEAENKHYITIWMISQWQSGEATVTEPDKYQSIEWRDFESLPSPLFLPWRQLMKSEFFEQIKQASRQD